VAIGRDSVLLERYRVVEPIAGGSNQVFLGTDERLWRPVCVKVFSQPHATGGLWLTAYEHFVQEAFSLSTLGHPNTVRIYDFGYLRGRAGDEVPFQVLEFLDGGSLGEVVRSHGPLGRDEACEVILGLAGALTEAHAQGLVHRDVKPANVMFHGRGRGRTPKLVDFGIAKALDPTARGMPLPSIAEDTDVVAGGPIAMYSSNWSAPEQFLARPVDVTADVYSFGLLVTYLLTGQVVLRAQTVDDALALRRDSDARIAAALAEVEGGPAVTSLLQRACAFAAADRPRAIAELGAQLVQRLETEIVTAPPTPVIRIDNAQQAEIVTDRLVQLVHVGARGAAISCGSHGARVSLDLVPAGAGRPLLSVRGVNCFVGLASSRPTSAVQVAGDCDVVLVTAELRCLGRARVRFAEHGALELDGTVIELPGEAVVALDFGRGEDCIVVSSRRSP
jgi:serine/threonine-protein kinase